MAWVTYSNGNDATTAGTTDATWVQWNTLYLITAATSNNATVMTTASIAATWVNWNTAWTTNGDSVWHAEQQACREFEASDVLRREAQRRADEILRDYLDARQRDTYEKHRWFEIVSPRGRKYRVTHGQAGNVFLLDESGRAATRYCIHPVELVPDEDAMLAQALMIQACEDEFERVANKTPLLAAA